MRWCGCGRVWDGGSQGGRGEKEELEREKRGERGSVTNQKEDEKKIVFNLGGKPLHLKMNRCIL